LGVPQLCDLAEGSPRDEPGGALARRVSPIAPRPVAISGLRRNSANSNLKKTRSPPRDLECMDGIWIISAAMKAVLEAVDPEVCEFRRCETVLPSGEAGRETWLCTINRAFVGAVDVEASERLDVRRNINGTLSLATHALTRLKFRTEVIGNAHLFHIGEMASAVFCDQTMKDACKAAGLKGVRFREISKS